MLINYGLHERAMVLDRQSFRKMQPNDEDLPRLPLWRVFCRRFTRRGSTSWLPSATSDWLFIRSAAPTSK